jgi:peptide/nickel transport system permease protein
MPFWIPGLNTSREKRTKKGIAVVEGSSTAAGMKKRLSGILRFLKRLVKEKPLGAVGAAITLILLFTGIFADLLAPYGMNEPLSGYNLAPPSSVVLLGADNVGRDVLSRVIFGARVSVIVGLAASLVATILSLFLGILTGYVGGKLDISVQRFVDSWMCIPQLILMIIMIAIIGSGMLQVIVVLGLSWGIIGSRIIRSAVIGIKENVYVEAARATGCPTPRIFVRHILPNIMAPTIVLFSVRVPNVILVEASLSFLGFGIPPPAPSWGGMLSLSGRTYMLQAPWIAFWPGLALAIVVFGVNMFGDALRDLLDPKLRGGAGRYGVRKPKKLQ